MYIYEKKKIWGGLGVGVDDFTICGFGNRGYGMGNHLKIQTKSIFKRFL